MNFVKKIAATASTTAATIGISLANVPQAFAGSTGIDSTLNASFADHANNPIYDKGVAVIKIVGGIGGVAFTLAVMIITIFIIFGSISPQKRGTYWVALISCVAGAFVFFGAFGFSDSIMSLATGPKNN